MERYEFIRIVPHPRTLRKARDQVMWMIKDGLSATKIKRYLHLWTVWWVNTSETWQYTELLDWFIRSCWNIAPAAFAAGLQCQSTLSRRPIALVCLDVA